MNLFVLITTDNAGRTPLMYASHLGATDIVLVLLEAGQAEIKLISDRQQEPRFLWLTTRAKLR